MTAAARKRCCPLSRSATAFALASGACCRIGCAPAAEAWTACPRRGVVVVGQLAEAFPSHLPLPTTNHRARCRPRREWGSIGGGFGRKTTCEAEEGCGGGGIVVAPSSILFRRECPRPRLTAEGPTPGGRRARRRTLRSQKSDVENETSATAQQLRQRRRFWRTLVAGLVAATVLTWLSPRVAAAASAAAASATEEMAGAAAAEAAASAVASSAAAAAETAAATTAAASSSASAAAAAAAEVSSSLVRPLGTLQVLPSRAEMELSLRLLFAALGGAAVGLERSSSDRPAGVRTMALVSLGAAAFTLCSMYGFMSVGALVGPDGPTTKYDPSRMASNVASGVGFIGAGVITNNRKAAGVYDRQSTVGGLTTAAAIWASAAIGVANGVGLYFIGASAAVSTILILRFGHLKHGHFWGGNGNGRENVTVGSKKKKTKAAESLLSATTLDGAAGLVNATSTMEGANASAVPEPSAAFAGDGMATKPKHGVVAIDAQLEELSNQEGTGKVISSDTPAEKPAKSQQYDVEEKMRADHGVKIKKVGAGPNAAQEAADTVLEIKSAPKKEKQTKNNEDLTFLDSPMPPPSTADPLLEKYLWGVDSFNAEDEHDEIVESSHGESSHHARHSIEEEQEVVFRDGRSRGGEKTRGEERQEGGSP